MSHALRASELWLDPYPLLARLRADSPVWQLPGSTVFIVSTWELVAEAVGRVDDFSNHFRYTLFAEEDGTLGALETGKIGPDVFSGADPPVHGPHRRIFLSELGPAKVDALEAYVRDVTDAALDPLLANGGGDLATLVADVIPLRVIADRVIGFLDPDLDRLRQWVFDGSRLAGGLMTLAELGARAGDVAGMATWTHDQLSAALRSNDGGPLLRATADAVRAGELTVEEAEFNLMVMVGAGAETTTALIGLAVAQLAVLPEVQAELRRDPSQVPAFIEEVLRFDSPFRFHPRTAARATQLGGVDIAEGALVLLMWASANRDGSVFDRPEDFVMGRANVHQHFGFGRGIHHCVGASLARLEARVVIMRLLERTDALALDPSADPRWSESTWIHRPAALPVCCRGRDHT